MSLIDLINKLIQEHGSSEILRDHLNLIKDQASLLEKENNELKNRLFECKNKLKELKERIHTLTNELDSMKRCNSKPKIKFGCLKFEDDENLYCPACFYKEGKKVLTSRKNIHYRYCAVCKNDIPSG